MTNWIALALLVAAPLPVAAAAAPVNTSAAVDIRALETASRMSPADGGAAIELASAYMQVGRYADAAAAYRRALATDNEMMETPSGDTIWSHDVARKMLARDVLLTAR